MLMLWEKPLATEIKKYLPALVSLSNQYFYNKLDFIYALFTTTSASITKKIKDTLVPLLLDDILSSGFMQVEYGLINQTAHTDEHIKIEDLYRLTESYKVMIKAFFGYLA
jgi:acetylornithine deacetylase/succinyl-diaminopimelate desuccinylase-like protein